MAAPGSPKVWVAPSFSRMATAASTALMRGMVSPQGWSLAPGEAGGGAEEAGVVQGPVARGAGGGHELGDEGAHRGDDALLAGGGGEDPQVLVVEVDAEARLEVAVEHLARLLVEHAAEHLDRRGGVHAVGLEEDDGLGEEGDVPGDDELVGGLDGLPGAGRADVDDRPADGPEDLLGRGEVLLRAADHDRQRRVL